MWVAITAILTKMWNNLKQPTIWNDLQRTWNNLQQSEMAYNKQETTWNNQQQARNMFQQGLQCSGCWEKMLSSNSSFLILHFQSFSKFFPSLLHQIFHWNIKNMIQELHSIKNCIKWKHEPNFDRKLSKYNFLQLQTSTPIDRFCKLG